MNAILSLIHIYTANYKYRFVAKLNLKNARVLEVGIGNNSPKIFKKLYPFYQYHGVDRDYNCNIDEESIASIDKFYPVDLETGSLQEIPDDYYDFIIIAHVVEHIDCGEKIIDALSKKINKNGFIYIEYPREESKKFPSMKGTLNFYDDTTHKRTYDIEVLKKILLQNELIIIRSGIKRDIIRIISLPLMIAKSLIKLGYIRGSVFWDLFGFSNYILAKKNR